MKRKLVFFALAITALGLFGAYQYQESVNKEKETIVTDLVVNALKYAHYDVVEMDDKFSNTVFDIYIERLDYTKKFLLKEDIDALSKYKNLIDDQLKANNAEFFELSATLIEKRTKEASEYYKDILAKPFDFTVDEEIQLDDEKNEFAKSKKELKESWRLALKYQVLLEINSKLKIQEEAEKNKDTSIVIKSFADLEKESREKILKRNDDWFRRLSQVEHFDILTNFLNSIANLYDPHTGYYPPKDKEDFDISISGQLEGIGATLQEKDGYIKVVNIVPGSPSWKGGKLKENDLILKVAQADEEFVDVVGMRLDKAVKLIRGKKGTTVRLLVKNVEGSLETISIVRDVVVIEETYAKSVIVQTDGKERVGYIYLPQFYVNFNEKGGGRRCSDDVLKEVLKLKNEGIDGLIIDLRNNGGGSLPDVVKMAGYFIKEGPIVQIQEKGGRKSVLTDTDPGIYYDGPLAVMVNGGSASASEIFAAALQDYQRAIIVGSEFTFGKGTVQRFLDLDQVVNPAHENNKPFGAIKLTFQKFYRINGGSTQLKGVKSDVVLPDNMKYLDYGERELEHHLEWDKINPLEYELYSNPAVLKEIEAASQVRINSDAEFALIDDKAKKIKEIRDQTVVSLNFDKFRAYDKDIIEANKKYDKIMTDTMAVKVIPLESDIQFINSDTVKLESAKKWHRGLKKDIYLRETVHIVNDMIKANGK
ncbi:MAG: carboxy terminal-processing peptidase [Bacteroidales bacterium]|nr:carboxy terminal-processing peptidase [Bacteroidales bacterium]